MIKALIDDLGRVVGACETTQADTGCHEYGWRDQDGILHVEGRARAVGFSRVGYRRPGIDVDDERWAWAEDKLGRNEPFKLYVID